MKVLYNAIIDKLNAEFSREEKLWIDFYRDQWTDLKEHSFSLPAVLIQFTSINWETVSQKVQRGELELTLHIGQNHVQDTHDGAPTREAALQIYDFVDRVHRAVAWLGTEKTSILQRVRSQESDANASNLHISTITYRCNVLDYTASDLDDCQTGLYPDLEFRGSIPNGQPEEYITFTENPNASTMT